MHTGWVADTVGGGERPGPRAALAQLPRRVLLRTALLVLLVLAGGVVALLEIGRAHV